MGEEGFRVGGCRGVGRALLSGTGTCDPATSICDRMTRREGPWSRRPRRVVVLALPFAPKGKDELGEWGRRPKPCHGASGRNFSTTRQTSPDASPKYRRRNKLFL